MHKLTIILDDAHGSDVAGKGSPDGSHREWRWSKQMIETIGQKLTALGFNVIYSAPEEKEPGLLVRRNRMNLVKGPAIVFSLHNNAAGMGEWKNARGYSVWTTIGRTKSDYCGQILFDMLSAEFPNIPSRKDYSDKDADYESNFTVLTSMHPSVMLEWMFQDNVDDFKIIKDNSISDRLIDVLVTFFIECEKYLAP